MTPSACRRCSVLSVFLALLCGSARDTPASNWVRTYGGAGFQTARMVRPTSDGGAIVVGLTGLVTISDAWVVKLDADGNILWQGQYGGPSADVASAVLPMASGYCIVGHFGTTAPNRDLWVFKVDLSGTIIWSRTFGGAGSESGYGITEVSSQIVVAGNTNSAGYSSGGVDAWVLALDPGTGVPLWQYHYGGVANDYGIAIDAPATSEIYLAGSTSSGGAGGSDLWVVKMSDLGIPIWSRTLGGIAFDGAVVDGGPGMGIDVTADGGAVVGGVTRSAGFGGPEGLVFKLSGAGALEWQRLFGGSQDDGAYDVKQTRDGGYVVAARDNGFRLSGLKFGPQGDLVWKKMLTPNAGGSVLNGSIGESAIDGSLFLAGHRQIAPGDAAVVKTDPGGEVGAGCLLTSCSTLLTTVPSLSDASMPVVEVATADAGLVPAAVTATPTFTSISDCATAGAFYSQTLYALPPEMHTFISLPTRSSLRNPAELCAAIGPTAVSVRQGFPAEGGGGVAYADLRDYAYDCATAACTIPPGAGPPPPPTEPGCPAASCFCFDPGEGYEVVVSATTTVQLPGCDRPDSITLSLDNAFYWISVPYETGLVTAADLATLLGLTSTGIQRGSIVAHNPVTGAFTSVSAGTAQASALNLVPGRAVRVREPFTAPITYAHPTTSATACLPPCPAVISPSPGYYCLEGLSTGANYSWFVDTDADATIDTTIEPHNLTEIGILPVGAGAAIVAAEMITDINAAGTIITAAAASPNCFTLTSTGGPPELYVGAPEITPSCKVTSGGCTFNPTIRKLDVLPPTLPGSGASPIPALGGWGAAAVVMLLLAGGVYLLKRSA